jgi:uncharacterized protein (TIGR03435 family)
MKSGDPVRIRFVNYPLKDLIRDAYSMRDYQVRAPSWMTRDRFDLVATKPAGTSAARERSMLQSLLAERFHLTVHTATQEMPAYVLLLGKAQSKLRLAINPPDVPGCHSFGTLSEYADVLSRLLDRPVIDRTGISGSFYFILHVENPMQQSVASPGLAPPPLPPAAPPPCPGWSPETMPPPAYSIPEAVREQMGLRLQRHGTAQVDVLIVDHADRMPEPN